MPFWDTSKLSFNDLINTEIWQESPSIQLQIHHPSSLTLPGTVGAQQAMCRENPLPWVPDIVGRDWKSPGSFIIVGSAYAGFISEFSRRGGTIPLQNYISCSLNPDFSVFQKSFFDHVISVDDRYYRPIEILVRNFVDLSKFALFDLCRASFVYRGIGSDTRRDRSGDQIVKDYCSVFEKYIESPHVPPWTWRRICDSSSHFIIALGTIAEHGLLRLFKSKRFHIIDKKSNETIDLQPYNNGHWVRYFADRNRILSYWLKEQSWWILDGSINGTRKSICLLPVYHPSRYQNFDSGYNRTKEVIRLMINS